MFLNFWQKFWRNKKRRIYLDYSGATPISDFVLQKFIEVTNIYANPSAIHTDGVKAKQELDRARKVIADKINAQSENIYFTSTGSEAINLAIVGYIKNLYENRKFENFKPKIITSTVEHSATLEALKFLEKMNLIEIIYIPVDRNCEFYLKSFRESISDKAVVMVAIMYVNNETGSIFPVKEIGKIIKSENENRENKIVYMIDACQALNYIKIDVYALQVDLLVLNSSKIYGPRGVAMLYKKSNVKLSPIVYGGGQENGLRSGTENLAGIVAFAEAINLCEKLREEETIRLLQIQKKFIDKIKQEISEIKIYTRENFTDRNYDLNFIKDNLNSIPNIINIGLPGLRSDETVIRLDNFGYSLSHKSSCKANDVEVGSYVIKNMGYSLKESNENIRISMGRYIKEKDMLNLVKDLKYIYEKYKK